MAKTTHEVHGIKFNRSGSCKQCGLCGCNRCPHGVLKDGKWTCSIYETREEVCKPCSEKKGKDMTHQQCIDFPNHPFLWVINQKKCGYTFTPVKQEDQTKLDKLEVKF